MNEREKFDMSDKEILAIALANGFQLKQQSDGSMSLHPYVWKFAHSLIYAALSTRKAYGYGIVDKDGEGRVGFGAFSIKESAESECYYMNEPVKNVPPLNGSPLRVVELFYEDKE